MNAFVIKFRHESPFFLCNVGLEIEIIEIIAAFVFEKGGSPNFLE